MPRGGKRAGAGRKTKVITRGKPTENLNIRLSPAHIQKLKKHAKKSDLTTSDLIRRLVEQLSDS